MGFSPLARIDLAALRHNLAQARRAATGRRLMAVVKANAYGHGLENLLATLADADALAVARVGEGQHLRDVGFQGRLVILGGCLDENELQQAARLGLELVLHQPQQMALLEQARLSQPLPCWLKVDTGMHRLGFEPDEAIAAFERLSALEQVAGQPGLLTHLANADDRADSYTREQLTRFRPLAECCGVPVSIANSAGILGWPDSHGDWIRPGLMLYGVSPFPGDSGADHGLRPVMTLSARLVAVKQLKTGDAVGYGGAWRCPEDMTLGVVGVGYGDGYPRELAGEAAVLLNGRRTPVVGRVSMDMLTLDLRDQPGAQVGDPVVLWGEGLPVEEVARWAGTIPYTLLCGVTGRVRFQIHDAPT